MGQREVPLQPSPVPLPVPGTWSQVPALLASAGLSPAALVSRGRGKQRGRVAWPRGRVNKTGWGLRRRPRGPSEARAPSERSACSEWIKSRKTETLWSVAQAVKQALVTGCQTCVTSCSGEPGPCLGSTLVSGSGTTLWLLPSSGTPWAARKAPGLRLGGLCALQAGRP